MMKTFVEPSSYPTILRRFGKWPETTGINWPHQDFLPTWSGGSCVALPRNGWGTGGRVAPPPPWTVPHNRWIQMPRRVGNRMIWDGFQIYKGTIQLRVHEQFMNDKKRHEEEWMASISLAPLLPLSTPFLDLVQCTWSLLYVGCGQKGRFQLPRLCSMAINSVS